MARLARVVVPGVPHHVTQRGGRRMTVYFCTDDFRRYLELLRRNTARYRVQVWSYCLMPNHVHLILVPACEKGLARALARTHRRYALEVNQRHGWKGHLWQERFFSCPMDERHAWHACRYVLLNPVRAGLAETVTDWPHSSARAHLVDADDPVLQACGDEGPPIDWENLLRNDSTDFDELRMHTRTGRPLGSADFVRELERRLGRRLRPRPRGPRPRRSRGPG